MKNIELALWEAENKLDIWQGNRCWTVDIKNRAIDKDDEIILREDGFSENKIKEINKWIRENIK